MNRRPVSVTIVSWIFIAVGGIGLVAGLLPVVMNVSRGSAAGMNRHFLFEIVLVSSIRLVAAVSGVFMLRGANWARWVCVAWLGYHVVLSMWHSPFELIMHSVMLVVAVYILWRQKALAHFRGRSASTDYTDYADSKPPTQ